MNPILPHQVVLYVVVWSEVELQLSVYRVTKRLQIIHGNALCQRWSATFAFGIACFITGPRSIIIHVSPPHEPPPALLFFEGCPNNYAPNVADFSCAFWIPMGMTSVKVVHMASSQFLSSLVDYVAAYVIL